MLVISRHSEEELAPLVGTVPAQSKTPKPVTSAGTLSMQGYVTEAMTSILSRWLGGDGTAYEGPRLDDGPEYTPERWPVQNNSGTAISKNSPHTRYAFVA